MTKLQTLDPSLLEETLDTYQGQQGAIIPVLRHAQQAPAYLPGPALLRKRMDIQTRPAGHIG